MSVTIKRKRHACVFPPTPHPRRVRRSVRHVLMEQRDVTDNATSYNRWDPEQKLSEDRTDEGQVRKICSVPVVGLVPAIFGRWSPAGPRVGRPETLEAHGGVRLLPCTRIHLCFVLAVDLSTQHQHPVHARSTWDFALPARDA